MASFPTSVKAFTRQVDGISTMDAADVNEAYDEIEALEDALFNGKYNTLSRYTNLRIVDRNGNGNYPTLPAALAGITDASATNRYGIGLAPGRYPVTAGFNLIKEGIDLFALAPGTVTLYAAATALTMCTVGEVATTSESLISGIIFDSSTAGLSKALVLSNTQPALCRFDRCAFIGGYTRPTEFNSSQAMAWYRFTNCVWTLTGEATFCILIQGTARVDVSHSLIQSIFPTLAAPPVRIIVEGFAGRFEYCTVLNASGDYSFSANTARTMRIYHCAMNKPMQNVTSSIATPYNVIDANL
ncbi:hypothetical protein PLCT1_00953 [Planctomycetaceae bacterium]|nr:hypothetical protein PLCT1_00953 [Planctomycetaceae bacterium]